MTSVLLFLLATAFAIALLAFPFIRRDEVQDRRAFDLSVYRDQLAELDRDLERGVIDAEASRAAKVEIERRILALAADEEQIEATPTVSASKFGLVSTAALVISVPLASALLYLQLGTPDMPDQPLAARIIPEQNQSGEASVLANIQEIRGRLEAAPEDGELWALLARTQLAAGLYGDAAGSFNKAISYEEDDLVLRAQLGEAMVYAAEGQVTPRAVEVFEEVVSIAPNEPRARYYLGMAMAQEGNIDGALAGWSDLLASSPANAPWRQQIIGAVRSMLQNVGRPADEVVASLPDGIPVGEESGITSQAGLKTLAPDEQNEQIRGMVEGLAARLENEPGDVEGWVMLGRSRMVLGEPEAAKEAFEQAIELAPDQPEILVAYAATLLKPSETPGGDPIVGADAKKIYEKLLTLAPDDPEPRWLLGLAALQNGNDGEAVSHWQALLGLIEEGSSDHDVVEARITALESGEPAAKLAAGATPRLNGLPEPIAADAAATAGSAPSNGSGPQPSAEDRAEMAALSPTERDDRIRSMVDGLAARLEDDPNNIEGWLRLAQSRQILSEPDAAKEAYRRALEIAPERPDVIRAFASSLLGENIHPETNVATVGDEAAGLYQKLIELVPDDPEANWYLGLVAVQNGTIDDAKAHWQRVLDVLGPDHPNYAAVQSSLQQVGTETQ